MKIHELKTWPQFYQPTEEGKKRFEIREDDRGFEAGDLLLLREYDTTEGKYTGREMMVKVDFLMRRWSEMGLKDGYVIMSISRVKIENLEVPEITNIGRGMPE